MTEEERVIQIPMLFRGGNKGAGRYVEEEESKGGGRQRGAAGKAAREGERGDPDGKEGEREEEESVSRCFCLRSSPLARIATRKVRSTHM
jgi:hypothetical protein